MANGQLIAARYPAAAGPDPFYRLNIIDNGDGTCSVYIEDRANSDSVSTAAAVTATGLQIKGSAGSTPPGGANTQVQYNNNGVFGGIVGQTTDGIITTFATGDIKLTNILDTVSGNRVFIASGALFSSNVFIGQNSGNSLAGGTRNVAMGDIAAVSMTTGSSNTAIGAGAMASNQAGVDNTAVGDSALSLGATGNNNVAVGFDALQHATADANTAVGFASYAALTSGVRNVGLGYRAGLNTNGSDNVIIGFDAGNQVGLGSGNVFIGSTAGNQAGTVSNKLVIANSNTTTPLIGGDFSAQTLQFNGTGGITNYKGRVTAGAGLASIRGFTSQKAETNSADANVLTVTPPAAAGTYRVEVVISVSSATNGIISWTLSYKDSNGNAVTTVAQQIFQQGTAAPNTTFTTSAAGNYYGSVVIDVDNSATNIVVGWVGGGTSAAKMSASIEQLN